MAGGISTGGFMVVSLVVISLSLGGRWVGAQVHHVVGGDRGWDSASNIESWSSGRVFRVGDKIWFTYSAAQESLAELRSSDEFESCEISNPIRMYTGGIDMFSLDGEGTRYFASGSVESCNIGLKLHIEVLPRPKPEIQMLTTASEAIRAVAAPSPVPSASVHLQGISSLLWVGLALLCFMGL
ncbi:hypothetical protein HHK36_003338 [Tetracentron sinense]|uniref:Phytocyanin domain-containing protein n=1 Tax=Tetracentron sinense TaxID=13715 RepID=A0A834ZP36_TETSI|nr:hypothetical protein HHK36_003338 [Tetracentron sinense]